MRLHRCWIGLLIVLLAPHVSAETIAHGRFDRLVMYRPRGEVQQTVLFFSGEQGWTAQLETMARSLARQGALVAGIDSSALFRNLEQDEGDCVSPDGDLENLSHFLQAYYRLPVYRPALLIGVSSGAQFVHAMLEQAPAGIFGGGISLGFCPGRALKKPLCSSNESASPQPGAPWLVMQGIHDAQCRAAATRFLASVKQVEVIAVAGDAHGEADFHVWESQFMAAFRRLAARTRALPAVAAAELKDLPLIEVAAATPSDTFAMLISGDGGWAGIDKALAATLSRHMPVVGLDSLRYFWTSRTPEGTAADVDRVLRYYLDAWGKRSILLIGFSQGADVMPFVVNRLSEQTRARLRMVALLSPSPTAVFEFHLANWLGAAHDAIAVGPELMRMNEVRALCVYGADDTESMCVRPQAKSLQRVKLSGGHHFDGDYAGLASLLLSHMR